VAEQPAAAFLNMVPVQHSSTSLVTNLMKEAIQPNEDDGDAAIQPVHPLKTDSLTPRRGSTHVLPSDSPTRQIGHSPLPLFPTEFGCFAVTRA
jgi:hypothetical protein